MGPDALTVSNAPPVSVVLGTVGLAQGGLILLPRLISSVAARRRPLITYSTQRRAALVDQRALDTACVRRIVRWSAAWVAINLHCASTHTHTPIQLTGSIAVTVATAAALPRTAALFFFLLSALPAAYLAAAAAAAIHPPIHPSIPLFYPTRCSPASSLIGSPPVRDVTFRWRVRPTPIRFLRLVAFSSFAPACATG